MKHYLLLLALLAAALAGCADEPSLEEKDKEEEKREEITPRPLTQIRTPEQAADLARSAKGMFASSSRARRAAQNVTVDDVKCLTSAGADTLLYVVNYTSNAGFALISPDPNDGVLGVTDSGHFESLDQVQNPGMRMVIGNAMLMGDREIAPGKEPEPINPFESHRFEEDTVLISQAAPRLEVTWGQEGPGKYQCPNKNIGCGPLTGAMVMSYFETPNIALSHQNNEILQLDWNIFKDSTKLNCNHESFDLLCREIGHRMNAYYSLFLDDRGDTIRVTGVDFGNCWSAMTTIIPGKISQIYTGTPNTHIKIADSGIIVMGSLAINKSGVQIGHIYAIDGYKYSDIILRQYKEILGPGGVVLSSELISEIETIISYCHVNWGYYGHDNGYFRESLLCPSKAISYDDDSSHSNESLEYNSHQYFIVK